MNSFEKKTVCISRKAQESTEKPHKYHKYLLSMRRSCTFLVFSGLQWSFLVFSGLPERHVYFQSFFYHKNVIVKFPYHKNVIVKFHIFSLSQICEKKGCEILSKLSFNIQHLYNTRSRLQGSSKLFSISYSIYYINDSN